MRRAVIVAVPGMGGTWWTVDHPERGVLLPGGKVEPGEPLAHAASRELYEETGVHVPPWRLEAFAAGIIPGAETFQVTAFLAPLRTLADHFGEPYLRPGLRTLDDLRAAPWAARYGFHRAVYDRLEREQVPPNRPRNTSMNSPYKQLRGRICVDMLEPDYSDVPLSVFASALAHINRYSGHVREYSVAQHSVHVCRLVRDWGASRGVQRGALLHDAHEAVIGDITTPVKRALGRLGGEDAFRQLDALHTRAVEQRFHTYTRHRVIKVADAAMCLAEANQLLGGREGPDWPSGGPADIKIPLWDAERAAGEFLREAARLGVR